jgi:hypothetical protein
MEYLSQVEIEMLLTAINTNDPIPDIIEYFESFLTKRKFEPEKIYGIFDNDITGPYRRMGG